ncbi:MAG: hypothetical protein ACOZQL_06765 [Myxococcota bacterium]
MEPSPPEVEFEHRRLRQGALPPSLRLAREEVSSLQAKLLRRARAWRFVFLVAGAASIAWATQRLGIPLPGALCAFFGAIPLLWVGGWLFGFFVHARRSARTVAQRMGSARWQGELEAATVIEKVRLSMSSLGLHLTRDGVSQVVGWARVRMERVDPSTLALFVSEDTGLAMNEGLLVPRSAFGSDGAFDDFCLAMQRFIWEAQRRA